MEEGRRPSRFIDENKAVLLFFINILVSLTDEFDYIQRLLLPKLDQFFSSFGGSVFLILLFVSGNYYQVDDFLLIFGGYLLNPSMHFSHIDPIFRIIILLRINLKTIISQSKAQMYAKFKHNQRALISIFKSYKHIKQHESPLQIDLNKQWLNKMIIIKRFVIILLLIFITQRQMSEQKDANIYVVEQVEISSDSDTQQLLQDVHDLDQFQNSLDDIQQLEGLMRSTLKKTLIANNNDSKLINYEPKHVKRLQVVDDFIRNFLNRYGMNKTLNSFQKEWYQCVKSKQDIPDAQIQNEVLKDEIQQLQNKLQKAIVLSEKAKATYDKLLKERDFHKMHHQRVQKDKKKLNQNIQRLHALQNQYEKKYQELTEKYNFTMKEKMLIKIQRDKLKVETQNKKQPLPAVQNKTKTDTKKIKFTPFPQEQKSPTRPPQSFNYKQTVLGKTQKAHTMAVCTVIFHPKKPIIGTGSDDMIWKIWTVNQSQLIMSGQGHKDWVSSMKFHPRGHHILTGSGDSTVKVWDFVHSTCTFTFKDHRQPVWSIDLNRTGDYVATGSLDSSCRLLDINVGKCRSVFRGHVDSVTSVNFQPTSNLLASASADKTVSIWDTRMALCIQTFYGHQGAVNGCKFNSKGDRLASCDSTGIVKSWDLRAGVELNSFSTDKRGANCISIDRSGSIIAVGTDQALIYLFNDTTGDKQVILKGHDQKSRVQAVQFDPNSKMIVSGGSDNTYRIWQ